MKSNFLTCVRVDLDLESRFIIGKIYEGSRSRNVAFWLEKYCDKFCHNIHWPMQTELFQNVLLISTSDVENLNQSTFSQYTQHAARLLCPV